MKFHGEEHFVAMITKYTSKWFRYLVVWACISAIFFPLLSGCARQKKTIKIGIATTLTGPASTSGIHARNAALLAVDQINKAGGIRGRQVELVIKDDKGQVEDAIRVDRELVAEGVVAIIGHYLSTLSVKAVPYLNEKQVLMISSGATTSELTGLDDFLIRLMVPDERRAQLMAAMAYARFKVRKMAVVYDLSNPNYTVPFSKDFQTSFALQGGMIAASVPFNSLERYSAADIASKVINSGAEGVLLITNAINGALLCQHLRRDDQGIKIIASPWTLPEVDFVKNGGVAVDGTTCLVEFDLQSKNTSFLTFKEHYKSRYYEEVSLNGYIAYEVTQVLFEALAKTEDPRKLKQTILQQGRFKGLVDTITFDKFGDPTRPLYILEIKNSVITTIGKIEL